PRARGRDEHPLPDAGSLPEGVPRPGPPARQLPGSGTRLPGGPVAADLPGADRGRGATRLRGDQSLSAPGVTWIEKTSARKGGKAQREDQEGRRSPVGLPLRLCERWSSGGNCEKSRKK